MKQILIVEDDSFLNKMLAYNLTADGYEVTSALNTRTATDILNTHEFDLVLLDVKCAGISISETELIATVLDILKRELAAVLGDYALLLNDNIQKQEKEAATREKINRAKLQLNQSREFLQTLYENLMNGADRKSTRLNSSHD